MCNAKEGCLVPLAAGGSGCTAAAGTVTLPVSVCQRLHDGSLRGVRVSTDDAMSSSTSCATYTSATPLCGPWSSVSVGTASGATDAGGFDATQSAPKDASAEALPPIVEITVLASGQSEARGLTIDSTSVYWGTANTGTVMKLPLDGGTPTTLAANQVCTYKLAVDSKSV